jgi:hypothetical protein
MEELNVVEYIKKPSIYEETDFIPTKFCEGTYHGLTIVNILTILMMLNDEGPPDH